MSAPGSQKEVGSPFLAGALKCVIKGVTTLPRGGGTVICFLPEKARELGKESWREQESEKRWAGSIMTLIIQLQQLWQRALHCSRAGASAPSSHPGLGPLCPTPLPLQPVSSWWPVRSRACPEEPGLACGVWRGGVQGTRIYLGWPLGHASSAQRAENTQLGSRKSWGSVLQDFTDREYVDRIRVPSPNPPLCLPNSVHGTRLPTLPIPKASSETPGAVKA